MIFRNWAISLIRILPKLLFRVRLLRITISKTKEILKFFPLFSIKIFLPQTFSGVIFISILGTKGSLLEELGVLTENISKKLKKLEVLEEWKRIVVVEWWSRKYVTLIFGKRFISEVISELKWKSLSIETFASKIWNPLPNRKKNNVTFYDKFMGL